MMRYQRLDWRVVRLLDPADDAYLNSYWSHFALHCLAATSESERKRVEVDLQRTNNLGSREVADLYRTRTARYTAGSGYQIALALPGRGAHVRTLVNRTRYSNCEFYTCATVSRAILVQYLLTRIRPLSAGAITH